MYKILPLLLLSSIIGLQHIQAQEVPATNELLAEGAARITSLFERKFQVRMASPELGKLLSAKVAEVSRQMGLPVTITVSHFKISHSDSGQECQVVLTKDTPLRETLEPQADALLQSSGISNMLCQATLNSLQQAGKILLENQGRFTLISEKQGSCDYRCEDLAVSFAGATVGKIIVRVDKASRNISNFLLEMQDQTAVRVSLKMATPKDAPDGQVCPLAIRVEQNLQEPLKGLTVPKTINARFAGYEFL